MESYEIFKDLAIIIISAKLFGLLARKLKAPQVVGEIVAGLIIGPCVLGWVNVDESGFLTKMAEIGVVLLMFMAGLGTNLKDLLKTGPVAFLIACFGVFVPMGAGFLYYSAFYGWSAVGTPEFYKAVFIGVILTATSVSITVQTLHELGHLKGKIGTTILSAAIIDDVIGILVLTFVVSFKDPNTKISSVCMNTILFFVMAIVGGVICYYLFRYIDKKYPHQRRIPIFGLALCFGMAYIAEEWFGIADITGAYVAGIILCSIHDSAYNARKMDINAYMIFGPIFFTSIGLKTDVTGMTSEILLFSIGFVLIGMISKVIGCGLCAKLFRYKNKDAMKIGVGMMTRGEVALIVSQKGLNVGLMEPVYFTAVILLIMCSSIITPVLMKLLYRGEKPEGAAVSAK